MRLAVRRLCGRCCGRAGVGAATVRLPRRSVLCGGRAQSINLGYTGHVPPAGGADSQSHMPATRPHVSVEGAVGRPEPLHKRGSSWGSGM